MSRVVSYILKSIHKASDFMVERAWFDVLSMFAATTFPGERTRYHERVIFVVFFSVMIYSFTNAIRENESREDGKKISR